jgi:prolyl-tRNA editing enzyme YbaK/EbsC (Cys-tRNA(Pro) deacylase)
MHREVAPTSNDLQSKIQAMRKSGKTPEKIIKTLGMEDSSKTGLDASPRLTVSEIKAAVEEEFKRAEHIDVSGGARGLAVEE